MQIYKCLECEKIITVLNLGDSSSNTLSCCKKPLTLIEESINDQDEHQVTLERIGNFVKINIYDEKHPMTQMHKIEFVILETTNSYQVEYLNNEPLSKTYLLLKEKESIINTYVYCNIHGLYRFPKES